ncbi:MAG: hypothetical protein EAY75_16595 [Bacteroidetes bacterium]|nr:MAG: hypothetical protein EAY75_16595 [Bacteroidota bacterium]
MAYKQVFPNEVEIAAAKKIVADKLATSNLTPNDIQILSIMQSDDASPENQHDIKVTFSVTTSTVKGMTKKDPWWLSIE